MASNSLRMASNSFSLFIGIAELYINYVTFSIYEVFSANYLSAEALLESV